MNASARRGARRVDAFPAWVDALSGLVMVIMFVLLVFMVSQFYLSNLLSGREEQLGRLNQQLSELTQLLDLERDENQNLREVFEQLSAELQVAVADRDRLQEQLGGAAAAQRSLSEQLAAALARADELEERVAAIDGELAEAYRTIEADRETVELRLAEIASLQSDIQQLRAVRDDLEVQVAAVTLTLRAAEAEAEQLGVDLEQSRSASALLQEALDAARSQETTLTGDLEQSRAEAARLAQELAASRTAAEDAEAQLTLTAEEILQLRDLVAAREADIARLRAEAAAAAAADAARRGELASAQEAAAAAAAAAAADAAARAEELAAARRDAEGLTVTLRLTEEDRDRLMAELAAIRDRSQTLEAQLSDEQERTTLAQREIEARDTRIEELVVALEQTEASLTEEVRLSSQSQALVASLSLQIEALRTQLGRVEAALAESESRVTDRDVEIATLSARLNQALVRRVEELNRYRSEFFGRLREVIGNRPDIRVVGDRFVFQSEVLFPSASDTLQEGGKQQLGAFARTLLEIAREFPPEIDWILRVDGHTDNRPIRTPEFPSNWELSTARATEVVRYLVEQGIPPERLAAAGFGEFQPLDSGTSDAAFARNRRIELKLDQR